MRTAGEIMIRRWDDQPLRRKGLVVIAIPLLMLLAILPSFLIEQQQLHAEQERVAHTLQVGAAIDHVLTLQLNAETSVRGYLLTDDLTYLQPYTTAQGELPGALAALAALVQDNPAQVVRAQQAGDMVAREMAILATLQATSQNGRDPTAAQLVASKRQMDDLRAELGAMSDEETSLLVARRTEAQRLAGRAQLVGVLAIAIGLIGSLLASLLFTQGIARRIQRLQAAATDLAQGRALDTPPPGDDEIGALGRQLVRAGHLLVGREEALRDAAAVLEERVRERTAALHAELAARQQVELTLQATNDRLTGAVADLERQTRDIGALNELGDYLQACRSPEEAAGVIRRLGGRLFPSSVGYVGVFRASQNLIEPLAAWGEGAGLVGGFAPEECWALRRGRPHRVVDRETDLVCAHTPEPGPFGYYCLPMLADGEALGVLHLHFPAAPEAGREAAQERLAAAVAERVGLTPATLRLQARLRDQSIRDPLTGLYNRRYLEESLDRELQRAERQGD